MQFHDLLNTHTQQDVELDKLFMDVAVYNNRIMGPAHVEIVVELACRSAVARRGVAHISMPVDLLSHEMGSDTRSKRNIPDHVSSIMAESAHVPIEDQLARAAAILNEGIDAPNRTRTTIEAASTKNRRNMGAQNRRSFPFAGLTVGTS